MSLQSVGTRISMRTRFSLLAKYTITSKPSSRQRSRTTSGADFVLRSGAVSCSSCSAMSATGSADVIGAFRCTTWKPGERRPPSVS